MQHSQLSFEVAREWHENDFIALMTWIEGEPLRSLHWGISRDLAYEGTSSEGLALRWLCTMCEALAVLHSNDLVHGDVSPRNMIVSGHDLVLIDYDFVTKIGERTTSPGTVLYCPPNQQESTDSFPRRRHLFFGGQLFPCGLWESAVSIQRHAGQRTRIELGQCGSRRVRYSGRFPRHSNTP